MPFRQVLQAGLVSMLLVGCSSSPSNQASRPLVGPELSGGVPAALQKIAGDYQSGCQHCWLPDSITVRIVDANGVGVSGDSVVFSTSATGTLASPPRTVSDAEGYASTSWRIGTATGIDTMLVTAAGTGISGNPAMFYASVGSAWDSPYGFDVATCRTFVAGKTYNYFTVEWSDTSTISSDTFQIAEASVNSVGSATVIKSVPYLARSTELGPYVATASTVYRYWWIRVVGATGSATAWAANTSNPTNVGSCVP